MKNNILRAMLVSATAWCGIVAQPTQATAQTASNEIVLSTDKLQFDGMASTKEIKILKGTKFELFSSSDWMTCTINKNGVLEVAVKGYDRFYPRKASIILTSKKTNYSKVIEVVQKDCSPERPEVVKKPEGKNLLFLTDMDLSKAVVTWIPEMYKNVSAKKNPIRIKGSRYENGVGAHAAAEMHFRLGGATRFQSVLAIDDEVLDDAVHYGEAEYVAIIDGKKVGGERFNLLENQPVNIDIDCKGGKFLSIIIKDCGSNYGDHISFGNPRFEYQGERPAMVVPEAVGK